jgi:hypothetical protein
MTAITPAGPDAQTPELWERIAGQGWSDPMQREAISQALRAQAIRTLATALEGEPGAPGLVAAFEADEEDDYRYGSDKLARELGLNTSEGRAASWLTALKVTSGESETHQFCAVSLAAADLVHAEHATADADTVAFYEAHATLLTAFVQAQCDATQHLLSGFTEVILHRGDVIGGDLPPGPINPNLRALASFATKPGTARSFALRAMAEKTGTPVVYSVIVPVTRIAATPATGAASAVKDEIVVVAGDPGDLATVTSVMPENAAAPPL